MTRVRPFRDLGHGRRGRAWRDWQRPGKPLTQPQPKLAGDTAYKALDDSGVRVTGDQYGDFLT
jgi:hypothetical protein